MLGQTVVSPNHTQGPWSSYVKHQFYIRVHKTDQFFVRKTSVFETIKICHFVCVIATTLVFSFDYEEQGFQPAPLVKVHNTVLPQST